MNITPQEQKDKNIFRLAMGISVFVFIVVIVLNKQVLQKPDVIPSWTYTLPLINAIINGTCSVLLMLSLYFIKKKNINAHKNINITTFFLSSLFLVIYILYHWLASDISFPKDIPLRTTYLTILISHIILAAIVLPLVLMSFYRGIMMQVELHKKIVRFAYPIWLYVTITGVIVYLMISPYYPVL